MAKISCALVLIMSMLNFFFLTDSRLTSLRKFIVWDFVMSSLTMFRQVLKIIFTFGIKNVCVSKWTFNTVIYPGVILICIYFYCCLHFRHQAFPGSSSTITYSMGVSNNLFYTYTIHITYIYIESFSTYFENNLLLQLSLRASLAGRISQMWA